MSSCRAALHVVERYANNPIEADHSSLMLTIYAAATNLRLLRHWARRQHGDNNLLPYLRAGAVPASPFVDTVSGTRISGAPPGA